MLMNQAEYDKHLKGFRITGCAIRSRDAFYFVAIADSPNRARPESDLTTRVIPYFFEEIEKRWGHINYTGYSRTLAGTSQNPESKFVGVDRGGQVMVVGGGKMEIEDIPGGRTGPIRGSVNRVRTINGFTHICSNNRGLARRDGTNLWTSLCGNLPIKPDPDGFGDAYGFNDFDAFDDGEVYCVGGQSDVWRFDGASWTQIDVPGNHSEASNFLTKAGSKVARVPLHSVCCAGDGYVYIGGPDGSVWKGRNEKWKLIHDDRLSSSFKDMVWFQDRVYCTSDYGLWEIVNDEVRPCDVSEEITLCSGNLAVADGVMLLAGEGRAAYHDGHEWKLMFNTANFT
ncbi:hypothetical protein MHY87_06165 [Microvirga sp. ACRRW]|uniref:hypothetical protein n=1 Tax=Microvirga sp. ACRRW TaxID=2918205 RepID=UPI001EF5A374|nr:hypothetical protein [Microvirga sp. ACRRW]MCG7392485.1 hypothetical protein [Microvirga sp. ACRRW]